MQFNIDNENQTRDLAAKLAPLLVQSDVIFLIGDLGAGKTTFARHLIQKLMGEHEKVPSPTFTLVQSYGSSDKTIHHYDLYRLPDNNAEDDIIELGWEDSVNDAITLVEWPDRLGDLAPSDRLEIRIERTSEEQRTINFKPYGNVYSKKLEGLS